MKYKYGDAFGEINVSTAEAPVWTLTGTPDMVNIRPDTEALCRELFRSLATPAIDPASRRKAKSKKRVSEHRLPSPQELGLDALQLAELRKQLILNKLG